MKNSIKIAINIKTPIIIIPHSVSNKVSIMISIIITYIIKKSPKFSTFGELVVENKIL